MEIEEAVAGRVVELFQIPSDHLWIGRSMRVGAGAPDLTAASYLPVVSNLSGADKEDLDILAYLRVIPRAKVEIIAGCLQQSEQAISFRLRGLMKAGAITLIDNAPFLTRDWRIILPEIVTVEAKVAKWKRAVEQAVRNTLFSHRAYIAVPLKLAQRIKDQSIFKELGIGIVSSDDSGEVKISREARRAQPRIWRYYYGIAHQLARSVKTMDRTRTNGSEE